MDGVVEGDGDEPADDTEKADGDNGAGLLGETLKLLGEQLHHCAWPISRQTGRHCKRFLPQTPGMGHKDNDENFRTVG